MKKIITVVLLFAIEITVRAEISGVSFKYASWNIGHFSYGTKYMPTIADADFAKYRSQYTNFLESVGADWIGVSEYSTNFTVSAAHHTRDCIFGNYSIANEGPAYAYQCNSQFASERFKILSISTNLYAKHNQQTYYIASHAEIEGTDIWIVQTHLDWINVDLRNWQIRKLAEDFKDKKHVVISGDFNASAFYPDRTRHSTWTEDYQILVDAGFNASLNEEALTYPDQEPNSTIDLIFAKGLTITNGKVADVTAQGLKWQGLSDHRLVSATITVPPDKIKGKTAIAIPSAPIMRVYNGQEQVPAIAMSDFYNAKADKPMINAGTYTVTVSLVDKTSTCWADGTSNDIKYQQTIATGSSEWIDRPWVTPTQFAHGTIPEIHFGTALYGKPHARYSAEEMSRLAPGNYTQLISVPSDKNVRNYSIEFPFTVYANESEVPKPTFKWAKPQWAFLQLDGTNYLAGAKTSASRFLTDRLTSSTASATNMTEYSWRFAPIDARVLYVYSKGTVATDGFGIDDIAVIYAGDKEWTTLPGSALPFFDNNAGGQYAYLTMTDGSAIATNIVGLKVIFNAVDRVGKKTSIGNIELGGNRIF